MTAVREFFEHAQGRDDAFTTSSAFAPSRVATTRPRSITRRWPKPATPQRKRISAVLRACVIHAGARPPLAYGARCASTSRNRDESAPLGARELRSRNAPKVLRSRAPTSCRRGLRVLERRPSRGHVSGHLSRRRERAGQQDLRGSRMYGRGEPARPQTSRHENRELPSVDYAAQDKQDQLGHVS